jgi:hypothetical protein
MAYDHPAYTVRGCHQPSAQAAGASKTYDKFVAFTALTIFSIGVTTVTAGTSSYTAWNGTATVTTTGTGDTITGFRVFAAGGTATYGPFALDQAILGFRRIQLSGNGTASYLGSATSDGGIQLSQGDQFYVQRGTDATAVQLPIIEYGLQAGASVSN